MRVGLPIREPVRSISLVFLLVLGMVANALPETSALADAPIEALDGHPHSTQDHGHEAQDHPDIGGHCHPGLECSLAAVMEGQHGVAFWWRVVPVSLTHLGRHLTSFIQVDDPPPPRRPV